MMMVEDMNSEKLMIISRKKLKVEIIKHTFVPTRKTWNMYFEYELEVNQYEKLLNENITKTYKHAPEAAYDDINWEARNG